MACAECITLIRENENLKHDMERYVDAANEEAKARMEAERRLREQIAISNLYSDQIRVREKTITRLNDEIDRLMSIIKRQSDALQSQERVEHVVLSGDPDDFYPPMG